MECLVVVRPESDARYVARPLGLPELEASAPTEVEAIARVREKLDQWLRGAKVVTVSVPGTGNPWLDTFGRSANDPDFEAYQAELERLRTQANGE